MLALPTSKIFLAIFFTPWQSAKPFHFLFSEALADQIPRFQLINARAGNILGCQGGFSCAAGEDKALAALVGKMSDRLHHSAGSVVVLMSKALIEANATVESVDVWGKRRLAYPIDYKTEGYYVLVNFASEAEFITELERIYNITDGVLRTIVIRK